MNYPVGLAIVALAACLWWIAVRVMRADARRFSNAGWIIAASVMSIVGLASLGFGLLMSAVVLVAVFAPFLGLALAVFLLYNGMVMVRKEGHSLANLLSLLAGIGLFCAIGLGIGIVVRDINWFPVSLAIALTCVWAAVLFFSFIGYSWLYQRLVGSGQAAYVIVLGCGLIGERVSPLLQSRIERAVQQRAALRATGSNPLLVMSGGKGPDEVVSEAEAMRDYALSRGVAPAELALETESKTTSENLRYSAAVVRRHFQLTASQQLPAGVAVTSNYHAMRTAMLARRLQLPIDALGAPTAGYFWPSAMLREFVAVIKDAWRWHLASYLIVVLAPSVLVAVTAWM